ncbi:cyclophilin-like protein [Gymnopus androsaceus JB14]|uniref:Peptidyl-prolyl cis-trans isomerase n=1 Tax=Gymnopus androsaceus JB14 TaxID=1447944 RepID=A0A6A4HND5_9AGAR|nr:cyclophilin-like protein [Gymnopus androsaceus JB14]
MHRIVKDYIAQGGDITRGDGLGGESIYGGKFPSSPTALSVNPKFGSLAMANAGPNTGNTSQYFVVLSSAESQLARIRGKYDVFGEVVDGWQVLERLNQVGTADGDVLCDVWVEDLWSVLKSDSGVVCFTSKCERSCACSLMLLNITIHHAYPIKIVG